MAQTRQEVTFSNPGPPDRHHIDGLLDEGSAAEPIELPPNER
jgi:hypothetical protein